jgi:phosphomannomutase
MTNRPNLECFKAYDIRGAVPDELNERTAYGIGRAFVDLTSARRVCVGRDMRLSGPEISAALMDGLNDAGADVLDIGLAGTEEIYAATTQFELDGGIAVTASHNPAHHNGMKLVRAESRPISGDTGLNDIRDAVGRDHWPASTVARGTRESLDAKPAYIEGLLKSIDISTLKPLKIVANPGNGCAGPAFDLLASHLPFEVTRVQWEPDGHFPNGVPNPILPENRKITADAVREHGADLGLAWDGDFDRCFFFDGDGRFIEGYYVVGLLAQTLLAGTTGERVIHDPRLTWNTVEIVNSAGGTPVVSKTGHAFFKERMREEGAIYGGEMSAHHYFRDFYYCDSGMFPWLLITALMSRTGSSLAELVDARIRAFPCSGEINFRVADASAVLAAIEREYSDGQIDRTDGLSVDYDNWRFNVRTSNTEPLLRLNVEAAGNESLMIERTDALSALIKSSGA